MCRSAFRHNRFTWSETFHSPLLCPVADLGGTVNTFTSLAICNVCSMTSESSIATLRVRSRFSSYCQCCHESADREPLLVLGAATP